jgi:pSer/pThr/pTyr-binding forkhead associated (FHA) protein
MKNIHANLKDIIKSIIFEEYKVSLSSDAISTAYSLIKRGKNINVSNLFNDSNLRVNSDISDPKIIKLLETASEKAKLQIANFAGNGVPNSTSWWEFPLVKGIRDRQNKTKFYITADPDIKNLLKFYETLPTILRTISTEYANKGKQIKVKFNIFRSGSRLYSIMNDFLIFYADQDIVAELGGRAKALLATNGVKLTERPFEVGKDGGENSHSGTLTEIMQVANKLDSAALTKIILPLANGKSPEEFEANIRKLVNDTMKTISSFIVSEKDIYSVTSAKKFEVVQAALQAAVNKITSTNSSKKDIEPSGNLTSIDQPLNLTQSGKKLTITAALAINKHTIESNGFIDSSVYSSDGQFTVSKATKSWIITPSSDAKNKTYLNGSKLTVRKPLSIGDIITIGNETEDKKRGEIRIS